MMAEEVYTERVYIDPERLLKLKRERKTFKLVPSIFEPPQETVVPSYKSTALPLDSLTRNSPFSQVEQQFKPDILRKSRNPNIDFVVSLLGQVKNQQIVQLQIGQVLDFMTDDRWLILEGELRIIGLNLCSYLKCEGYFFFMSEQTKKKIKQVQCVRETKLLRISPKLYQNCLRNYLFLKNAEKIKYLKYCPFFVWSDHLSQDLAASAQMFVHEREEVIYPVNGESTHIFFVKQGVVLLERSQVLSNPTIRDYQAHYEKNQISESETTLIVKKGMIFGIDGILLKEIEKIPAQENPESKKENESEQIGKKSTRVYTAKAMGRTEIYSIQREILETLFNLSDLAAVNNFSRELSKGDLQRICFDYADMVIRHHSLPKLSHAVTRKDVVLQQEPVSEEAQFKKSNARKIRVHQQTVRKQSIANIIAERKLRSPHRESAVQMNESLLNQLNQKLNLAERNADDSKIFAFPKLSSTRKLRVQPQQQSGQKYIFKWLKSEDPHHHPPPKKHLQANPIRHPSRNHKGDKLCLINVRSYRSIISSLLW